MHFPMKFEGFICVVFSSFDSQKCCRFVFVILLFVVWPEDVAESVVVSYIYLSLDDEISSVAVIVGTAVTFLVFVFAHAHWRTMKYASLDLLKYVNYYINRLSNVLMAGVFCVYVLLFFYIFMIFDNLWSEKR